MTGSEFELYDILEDSLETRNLARERPDIARELREAMSEEEWRKTLR